MCRGTGWYAIMTGPPQGLSPRVQGNPERLHASAEGRRSIPACAGEPRFDHQRRNDRRVYPRVCRGTSMALFRPNSSAGLSPRVQGNRVAGIVRLVLHRSIPACAGEPSSTLASSRMASVYPRVCRGTRRGPTIATRRKGLSPRVQGNLNQGVNHVRNIRSIPACAGEPTTDSHAERQWTVYPRVCRGTLLPPMWGYIVHGLSPRVQGNPLRRRRTRRPRGSIPACAGEPPRARHTVGGTEVYPRVCRGTRVIVTALELAAGLSPRVQGNHGLDDIFPIPQRSIPACAGEPIPGRASRSE